MSFIASKTGRGFAAGHFLVADEQCVRETATIPADHAAVVTNPDGTKYVPAGTIIDSKGILYEDIDVTKGDAPGSIVTKGIVYGDLLPATPDIDGIEVVAEYPTIERPY